jgi:hypothetical protein
VPRRDTPEVAGGTALLGHAALRGAAKLASFVAMGALLRDLPAGT